MEYVIGFIVGVVVTLLVVKWSSPKDRDMITGHETDEARFPTRL